MIQRSDPEPLVELLPVPNSFHRDRTVLAHGPRTGPMIIEEYEGTIVINPLSTAFLDETGNVVIQIGKEKEKYV